MELGQVHQLTTTDYMYEHKILIFRISEVCLEAGVFSQFDFVNSFFNLVKSWFHG